MSVRLSLALTSGAVALPDDGPVLLLRPPADLVLDGVPSDRLTVLHGFRPDVEAWEGRGLTATPDVDGTFAAAVVFAARAKALTLDLLAQAFVRVGPGGLVIVDGAKADGIESILKLLRQVAAPGEVFSKAHGKCFALSAPEAIPEGWAATPATVDGFQTMAGVFSADGIDPGSALLATHLGEVAGRVCDLGAGWGYLARAVLASPKVTSLALVEAEHAALDCARVNVPDPRATFHWADATRWTGGPFDVIVCNPPFHTGRAADPALGRAFVQAAARLLTPRGRLLMVANRHLPYEATLREVFADTVVRADQAGYKVIDATRPKRRQT